MDKSEIKDYLIKSKDSDKNTEEVANYLIKNYIKTTKDTYLNYENRDVVTDIISDLKEEDVWYFTRLEDKIIFSKQVPYPNIKDANKNGKEIKYLTKRRYLTSNNKYYLVNNNEIKTKEVLNPLGVLIILIILGLLIPVFFIINCLTMNNPFKWKNYTSQEYIDTGVDELTSVLYDTSSFYSTNCQLPKGKTLELNQYKYFIQEYHKLEGKEEDYKKQKELAYQKAISKSNN